ncbi:hypothetical protein LOK49_Contig27G00001 [Camellia lanceoleosa]|nr:hypothetical protein LOK49_Contig27G00001 [Camellia lanceoleosa]
MSNEQIHDGSRPLVSPVSGTDKYGSGGEDETKNGEASGGVKKGKSRWADLSVTGFYEGLLWSPSLILTFYRQCQRPLKHMGWWVDPSKYKQNLG